MTHETILDHCVCISTEPPVKILRKCEIKTDLKFLVSDDIVLECEISQANGNSKWYKDGCQVQGDERFCEEEEGAFRSLVILNAELKDSGEYFLDVGDDSISFYVKVEGKIQIAVTYFSLLFDSKNPQYKNSFALRASRKHCRKLMRP